MVVQAAHNEAAALGAVTAWYRDVQRRHIAAGLGDDPILATILPGSSRKLRRPSAAAERLAEKQVQRDHACSFVCIVLLRTHNHMLGKTTGFPLSRLIDKA